MKRSKALKPLSRDHHRALEAALKLKRADPESAGEAGAYFLTFWDEHCLEHFRVEEEVLLPALAEYLEETDPRVQRVWEEHADIRRRAADLEAGQPLNLSEINALGELLEGHVRHEERVVFPLVEESLPAPALDQLQTRISEAGDH